MNDQATGFRTVRDRLAGELPRRKALADRALNYHHVLFDDFFRAIWPHDLVLFGAAAGAGKSEQVLKIAMANAAAERRVHVFALEAEPDEFERRAKFALLANEASRLGVPGANEMDYSDWLLGRCEDICGPLNAMADRKLGAQLETMHTFYRGRDFGAADLAREVAKIADKTDLIIIDHLHYIDSDEDDNENRAVTQLIKLIRDLGLRIGKPVILVAHLRKRDERAFRVVPSLDDFHGSSNIAKIVTQAIVMERAFDIDPPEPHLAPTFIAMRKDRRSGASPLVALMHFDTRKRMYLEHYTLGRVVGRQWKEIEVHKVPRWAKHHEPLQLVPLGDRANDPPHAAGQMEMDVDTRRAGA